MAAEQEDDGFDPDVVRAFKRFEVTLAAVSSAQPTTLAVL